MRYIIISMSAISYHSIDKQVSDSQQLPSIKETPEVIPHNGAINIAEGGSITLDELLSATVVIEETNLENVSKRKNMQE